MFYDDVDGEAAAEAEAAGAAPESVGAAGK